MGDVLVARPRSRSEVTVERRRHDGVADVLPEVGVPLLEVLQVPAVQAVPLGFIGVHVLAARSAVPMKSFDDGGRLEVRGLPEVVGEVLEVLSGPALVWAFGFSHPRQFQERSLQMHEPVVHEGHAVLHPGKIWRCQHGRKPRSHRDSQVFADRDRRALCKVTPRGIVKSSAKRLHVEGAERHGAVLVVRALRKPSLVDADLEGVLPRRAEAVLTCTPSAGDQDLQRLADVPDGTPETPERRLCDGLPSEPAPPFQNLVDDGQGHEQQQQSRGQPSDHRVVAPRDPVQRPFCENGSDEGHGGHSDRCHEAPVGVHMSPIAPVRLPWRVRPVTCR